MVTWQEADALVNGIRLHYYRSGGSKPPLVLAHGITDSGLCWPQVSEALAPAYDVITIDARGHGKSEKPNDLSAYGREEHARDLAALIEALCLQRPVVMGHSMGAANSAVLAYRFPELVGALILEDPPWGDFGVDVGPPEHREMWSQRIQDRKKLSTEELIKEGKRDNPTWPSEVFPNWAEAKHQVSPNVVGIIQSEDTKWAEIISGIQAPTLLLTADTDIGEMGAITPPENAAGAERLCPKITNVHIEGAGHNIRREQFDAYIAAVASFLNEHYSPAS